MRMGGASTNYRRDIIQEQDEFIHEHTDEDQVSSRGLPPDWLYIPNPAALYRCGQPGALQGNIQQWTDGCGETYVSAEALDAHRKSCTERKAK
jgi:hypothetical protein